MYVSSCFCVNFFFTSTLPAAPNATRWKVVFSVLRSGVYEQIYWAGSRTEPFGQ